MFWSSRVPEREYSPTKKSKKESASSLTSGTWTNHKITLIIKSSSIKEDFFISSNQFRPTRSRVLNHLFHLINNVYLLKADATIISNPRTPRLLKIALIMSQIFIFPPSKSILFLKEHLIPRLFLVTSIIICFRL